MKKYTLDEIKALATRETVEGDVEIEDEFGNLHNIDEDIRQAENDIEKIKSNVNVNFRWSEFEVKRAKKIAKKMGMPYQTYIKFALKQTMDKDEQQFG